ncbi:MULTISPECIES: lysine N(6)-hydroxylase/L-ornithine N(5)-oxygenase family protein [unclassified Haloferax]|uniref:lysine N(6)-hydroxylase/L-ornithine N(5)-oxygenase family protein n=1 Tax=unclassified Haloferax TaxID=2625095 RepID=UPI000E248C5F|nr:MULTISPECIES: lysine N(6)-hydroxylase/L-ornithine N(5)-oxygenase family protein [unclassified Haloferax]RDZ34199.1 lysine 6-monooxygenase [Haloferax sp. Atlit-24N]RLM36098.1 lysine 6-monooxygenase [Haloferax sp. Atlit-109R]RLM41699.1 lysine 6-monooxygenase [Haloferax sp. Atlit-105R]
MSEPRVRDVVGIGLGPFNLGLAALLDGAPEDVDAAFLERDAEFAWHEGMLIEGTTLEVPFLADLVTLADPTSPHSYLNYLRETGRVYEFYFYETFQIPRREYNDYLRWVADRLDACRFEREVTEVRWDDREEWYAVTARNPDTGDRFEYRAENLALGIGSRPHVPEHLRGHPTEDVFHTARYRGSRERVVEADTVTVVGSGQSAAEVFQDLLERQPDHGYRLDWLTRSDGFFPMEYSKLGLQHFTPEYERYVYDLPQAVKDDLIPNQDLLYKGIDPETSAEIYDLLYRRSIGGRDPDVGLFAMTEVRDIEAVGDAYALDCHQWQAEESFVHESEVVILGTGYERPIPAFLEPLEDAIDWDEQGRFGVTEDHRLAVDAPGDVFLQNAEVHTHGVGVPDLGLGCYRNAKFVNRLVGREVYPDDDDTVFQDFSVAQFLDHAPNASRAEGSETPPTPTQDD